MSRTQQQVTTITGSIYDVYVEGDQNYKQNRMPWVGQRCEFQDGRKFVFCSTDANLVAGQTAGMMAWWTKFTSAALAASAGSKTISVVFAGVTLVNQYAGGYISITQGGAGQQTYKIKSSTISATVATVDNTIILTLYDRLAVLVTADNNVILKKSRYHLLIQGTASLDLVGVAVRSTTAALRSKTNYLWVQTAGVGSILGTAGANNIALEAAAAGSTAASTDGTLQIIAHGIEAGAVASMVNLCFPD